MMRAERAWAGWKKGGGVGWWTVPYERAMARVLEREEERAAPIVPEERANAAIQYIAS